MVPAAYEWLEKLAGNDDDVEATVVCAHLVDLCPLACDH
jgi:hypothetical protein